MARYVLGVDGGSTKTVALLADDQGHVLGAARGSGSNWSGEDVSIPMGVVIDVVTRAIQAAELKGHPIEIGVFTLSGADWPEDHSRRRAALEATGMIQQVVVKNDTFGGLRAGTSEPYGVGIVSGSGSNTAVITPDGREFAMGYYQNDGGAGHVAHLAFQAVLDADMGILPPTSLTEIVLHKLGYATPELMLRAAVLGNIDWHQVSTICPLVFEAAYAGDAVAADILVKVATYLADHAIAAIRRMGMEQETFDVVLAGSLFKGIGSLYVDTLTQAIHRVAPHARIVRARFEPSVGAVLLAYDSLKLTVTPDMYENLLHTAPEAGFYDTRSAALTEMG